MLRVALPDLRKVVAFCAKSAPRTATIEALKSLNLSVKGGRMTVTATNLDLWAVGNLPVDGDLEFAECIPAADLAAFCNHAPRKGEAILGLGKEALNIECEGASVRLPTAPAPEFPTLREAPRTQVVEPEFAEALQAALPATLVSSYAPSNATDGVLLDGDQCVGYDHKRLSVACVPCPKGVVIPREYAARIASLLSEGGRFGVSETLWAAEHGGLSLVGRLREGQYPNYRSNTEHPEVANAPHVACFSRDSLLEAVKRATLADRRGVKIEGANGEIVVSTFHKGATAKLQADGRAVCDGEVLKDFATHLDSKFALEALASMPDADVVLSRKSSEPQIAIFRPAERSAFLDRAAYVSEMRA